MLQTVLLMLEASELFKCFQDIPQSASPPMGASEGTTQWLLPHSPSQFYPRHTHIGKKCIPQLDFHHRTTI